MRKITIIKIYREQDISNVKKNENRKTKNPNYDINNERKHPLRKKHEHEI